MANGLSCSAACGIFWTKARTRVPCIGRRIPNHCATREVPPPRYILIISLRLCFFGKTTTEVVCPSQLHIRRYMLSVCLITGDINLDLLVKVVSAVSLHCIIVFFPFVIIIFWRKHFDTMQIFCSPQTCTHQRLLSATVIRVVF